MDDNTKIVNQPQAQAQVPTPPVQAPAESVVSAPVSGSVNKEMGPIGSAASQFSEVKLSGVEVIHTIDEELSKIGVKETQDLPELTDDHKQAGVQYSVPAPTISKGSIKYPMSDEEIADQLKKGNDGDSKKGLAKLIGKVMKVLGL